MSLFTSKYSGAQIEAAIAAALAGYTVSGSYATLAALNAAIPVGNPNIYLTRDNNHWNYWNGTTWADGGSYAGAAATVKVGTTTTGAPGTPASVSNAGTENDAVFNFVIPKGDKGDAAATIKVGDVITGDARSSAEVINTGTDSAVVLKFTIPRGANGNAATIHVGTTTTGAPGSAASVTNVGTDDAAVLNFTIPKGADGTGAGDMLKSTYDPDNDGVVDNAEKVNGHTVLSDVPANAPFISLDATATDIKMNGAQAAGSTGKAADAGHVHPTDTSRAASGSNNDITALQGLTTALSIAQGGTGVKTILALLSELGGGCATCTTAAATAAKVATLTGYSLVVGGLVGANFTYQSTVANATININGQGDKPIYCNGSAVTASQMPVCALLQYDGTNYNLLNPVGSNGGGVNIETGSYTGTGTYGISNPNSLTFSFAPKMVFISPPSASDIYYLAIFLYGVWGLAIQRLDNKNPLTQVLIPTWSNAGKTLSWYTQLGAGQQLNYTVGYSYVAIG